MGRCKKRCMDRMIAKCYWDSIIRLNQADVCANGAAMIAAIRLVGLTAIVLQSGDEIEHLSTEWR